MQFKKVRPYLSLIFAITVCFMLFKSMSSLDWLKIKVTLSDVPVQVFIPALMLSLINYSILSHFDFLGIRFFQLPLSYLRSVLSASLCYIFNLNLGALVGGLAFRFRIYMGWGIPKEDVPLIMVFSTVTNWTGYVLLTSLTMMFETKAVSGLLNISPIGVRFISIFGCGLVVAYLVLCLKRFRMSWKKKSLKLPRIHLALVQILLSCLQWLVMAWIVFYFILYFKIEISYHQVLFTYLMASMVGLLTHIPAGLGVVEAIFLKLSHNSNPEDLILALLCFRIVYYLIPLVCAIPGYLYLEYFQKRRIWLKNI